MSQVNRIFPFVALAALAACDSRDQTRDFGLDAHPLTEMQAGIWIDPNGCHHWIIDDGVEGFGGNISDLVHQCISRGLDGACGG